MARRIHQVVRGRSQRRATTWLSLPPTVTAFTVTGGTILLSLTAEELAKRPFTIIRTYFTVHIQSDIINADERQAFTIGMCVVSEQAEAIGVTAVPTPDTDRDSDLWFIHGDVMADLSFVTGVGFDADGGQSKDFMSKSMRKVNNDEEVVMVGETTAGISDGMIVRIAGRMLIKEH